MNISLHHNLFTNLNLKSFTMKRKIWGLTLFLLGSFFSLQAQNVSSLSWGQVCSGKMESEWYGSEEAQKIADDVIYVQRTSGGWMKNEDLHKLTPAKDKRYTTNVTNNLAWTTPLPRWKCASLPKSTKRPV